MSMGWTTVVAMQAAMPPMAKGLMDFHPGIMSLALDI
jgi:hypothetical protein